MMRRRRYIEIVAADVTRAMLRAAHCRDVRELVHSTHVAPRVLLPIRVPVRGGVERVDLVDAAVRAVTGDAARSRVRTSPYWRTVETAAVGSAVGVSK